MCRRQNLDECNFTETFAEQTQGNRGWGKETLRQPGNHFMRSIEMRTEH